jgi:enoyl-CoA hydratase
MTTINKENNTNYQYIKVDIASKVAVVTIDRPPVNPLNSAVFIELTAIFSELEQDKGVHAIILTGNGQKAFVAGADIHEMSSLNAAEMLEMNRVSGEVYNKIASLSKPVIAAINGVALGGGLELALACDLRIASERAKFAFPEVGLGIIPGGGGTQRLQKIVGQGIAKELLFFGEMFDAQRAIDLQIVNKVVPVEEVLSAAKEWALKLAEKPVIALRMLKLAVNEGANADLTTGLALEMASFSTAFATDDRIEGMAAFVEKRKPTFTGK